MGKTETEIVSGHIEESDIQAAIKKIQEVAMSYKEIRNTVDQTTRTAKQNWVGKGRDAFENQYDILICKIKDFGDTLDEICDGLINADAAYQEADNSLNRSYVKSTEGMV